MRHWRKMITSLYHTALDKAFCTKHKTKLQSQSDILIADIRRPRVHIPVGEMYHLSLTLNFKFESKTKMKEEFFQPQSEKTFNLLKIESLIFSSRLLLSLSGQQSSQFLQRLKSFFLCSLKRVFSVR